ncbi:MAG: serine hydrolase domain-containing protein [Thermomicrobiales bacterium]
MANENQLQLSTPEAEGIPSAAILAFVEALERHDNPLEAVQGFILVRHGKVAAEGWWAPYGPEYPHSMFSLSKSFTSTAIGLAVNEGLLSADDHVLKFFPDDAPEDPSEHLMAMQVRHLLAMNTGHHEDTTGHVFRGEDDNWPRAFLSLPVEHEPDTWFVYNTAATYMLSAIITKLTGESLLEYLRPRLFAPLGIDNPTWETDPRGINIGGSGLHIKTGDIARFGQLYLQKGNWNGTQIVPEAWIAEATTAHSDNSNTQTNPDWKVGYGYQFWRCQHNAYRGDGAFGQFCVVMPEQDAVLAITSGLRDMQGVLDKVWEHLLPAMQAASLPADAKAHGELGDKLATLSLPLPEGEPTSPRAEEWSGKTYELVSNDLKIASVTAEFGADHSTLKMRDKRGEYAIPVGHGTWLRGSADVRGAADMRGHGEEPVAASGAWTADDTFEVRICAYESEFCLLIRLQYADDAIHLQVEPNVSWGDAAIMTVTGRLAR